jgi:hypothetical protein
VRRRSSRSCTSFTKASDPTASESVHQTRRPPVSAFPGTCSDERQNAEEIHDYDIAASGDKCVPARCNGCSLAQADLSRRGHIENNLIEFNGSHVQFDHGIYASGERLVVRGNIIRHNASFGLHLYPSIKESQVENNLVHGHVRGRGIILACPEGGGKNRVLNNTVVESSSPLTIWRGNGEVVANNIFIADRGEAVSIDDRTAEVFFDHNFVAPGSHAQGKHGLTGDPRFVDSSRVVFWLRANSPAIGKGSVEHASASDFWGRSRPKGQKPDLGAFPYVPELEKAGTPAEWDHGWAYHRHGQKNILPDLWTLPSADL